MKTLQYTHFIKCNPSTESINNWYLLHVRTEPYFNSIDATDIIKVASFPDFNETTLFHSY
jgi:hypothetical protein